MNEFIGRSVLDGVEAQLNVTVDEFHGNSNKMRELDPLQDEAIVESEEKEFDRIQQLVKKINSRGEQEWDEKVMNMEEIEEILRQICVDEEGVGRIRLPDFLWKEGYGWEIEKAMVQLYGEILMRARCSNQKLIATILVNRNTVEARPGESQSALNGHHDIASDWLHNFVCVLFLQRDYL